MVESRQWQEVRGPLSLSLGITALVWLLLFVVVIFDPAGHHAGSMQIDQAASSNQTLPVSPLPSAFPALLQEHFSTCTKLPGCIPSSCPITMLCSCCNHAV